jgi:hypothetical protein
MELSFESTIISHEFAMPMIECILNDAMILLSLFTYMKITMHSSILEVSSEIGWRTEKQLNSSSVHTIAKKFSIIERPRKKEK